MDKSQPPPPPGFMGPPPAYMGPPPSMPPSGNREPNVIIVGAQQWGPDSQNVTCPVCHAHISTTIETEANTKTHLFAILLCVLGLWCCAPCPYCIDSCMVKKHYCPSCKSYLGQSEN
ncbi:lipopolysaccharide-induced tumor necrosis factor-alpha factor homolog [Colletes latitarsis]|uniref:lipopolysaccharide-induced tumor necrosis factor-alpha factor homolog n=1 Tax=Colletes latitarsis TaxID=2605962 RepID=UPI004036E573